MLRWISLNRGHGWIRLSKLIMLILLLHLYPESVLDIIIGRQTNKSQWTWRHYFLCTSWFIFDIDLHKGISLLTSMVRCQSVAYVITCFFSRQRKEGQENGSINFNSECSKHYFYLLSVLVNREQLSSHAIFFEYIPTNTPKISLCSTLVFRPAWSYDWASCIDRDGSNHN